MENNQTKYAACFFLKGGFLQSAEVVKGEITREINDAEVEFTGLFQKQRQSLIFPRKNIFDSKEEAEKKIEAGLAWKERNVLKKAVDGHIDFLPPLIGESKEVFFSGNPLRCAEPMICFGAQTNTWGGDDNPQKVLQMAGAIWEDIETLKDVLYVLGFANNYTKKLIGKYIVIELNSLFLCLKRLAELDADYNKNLFSDLLNKIKALEDKYKFKGIRDKVAAHRDTNIDIMAAIEFWRNITRYTINRYIGVFADHLGELLKKYTFEASMYFGIRKTPAKGIIGVQESAEYITFDEPFASHNNQRVHSDAPEGELYAGRDDISFYDLESF